MGRFTLPAFRFLMAVLNVRLGVWIRNPNRAAGREARERSRPESARATRRCIAVTRVARAGGLVRAQGRDWGWPTARGRYIYVSDGGHWENLGLHRAGAAPLHARRRGRRQRRSRAWATSAGRSPSPGRSSAWTMRHRPAVRRGPATTSLGEAAPSPSGRSGTRTGRGATSYYRRAAVMWAGATERPAPLRARASRCSRTTRPSNQFLSGRALRRDWSTRMAGRGGTRLGADATAGSLRRTAAAGRSRPGDPDRALCAEHRASVTIRLGEALTGRTTIGYGTVARLPRLTRKALQIGHFLSTDPLVRI